MSSTKTPRPEEDPLTDMDPNIVNVQNKRCKFSESSCSDSVGSNPSAKSKLLEVCATNSWKAPLFECCKEEGLPHEKVFTFKVTVEVKAAQGTILECYGAPLFKKKVAAESAAEGALWYLKHLGYFPMNK